VFSQSLEHREVLQVFACSTASIASIASTTAFVVLVQLGMKSDTFWNLHQVV
jgi:hypothetical protein